MLANSAVEPATLGILSRLMQLPELTDFSLVGGTALALRYGHRISVDLDFFATQDFSNAAIAAAITSQFSSFTYRSITNPVGVFGFIEDVKVDFVRHHHFMLIDEPVEKDGIRMFSDRDIMAMKIFAVLQRAVKKDFWDIAELLKHYSLADFIECYYRKYPSNQMLISIPHALTHFADADESEQPNSLKGQTWADIKKDIAKAVRNYLL